MWQRFWKTARIAILVLGGTLAFFVLIEVLRAYEVLRDLHPAAGSVFMWTLMLGFFALAGWYVAKFHVRSCALNPPPGVDPDTDQGKPLRAYARYQLRVMNRLARNPLLTPLLQNNLRYQTERLREALAAGSDAADLTRCVRNADADAIRPSLDPLDAIARQEVSGGVRDVMLVVTLSPWRSADLLVVLYRNLRMVIRMAEIYNARPPLREHAQIVRDVFTAVATVNIMNFGSNLLQNLTVSLPLLGRFADDIAQGVGAGLMTSVTGHSAVARCRAFGRWDHTAAEDAIRRQLRDCLADVKGVAVTEIVQRIRQPVEAQLPESARQPDLQRQIRDGITTAIDQTAAFMDSMASRPVSVMERGTAISGLGVSRTAGGTETFRTGPLSNWIEGLAEDLESAWKRLLRAFRKSDRASPNRGV